MKLKYTLVFSIISFFITTTGFAQALSDQEIGFDVARTTTMLKEHGVKDQDLTREIAMMREMQMHQHVEMKKVEDGILKKIKLEHNAKPTTNKSTAVIDIPQSEKDALKALYDATGGTNWVNKTGWDFNTAVTSGWYGITVSGGHVISIKLMNNQLNGTIPTEIGQLTQLVSIFLSNNNLSGTIPSEIGKLTNLIELGLNNNQLDGIIPSEIGQLVNL